MRKFLVRNFVLNYYINLFGKTYNAPRASRIIFPLMCITGYLNIEPDFWSWFFVGLTALSLYFGFIHFKIFKISRYELDNSQKNQYDLFKNKY